MRVFWLWVVGGCDVRDDFVGSFGEGVIVRKEGGESWSVASRKFTSSNLQESCWAVFVKYGLVGDAPSAVGVVAREDFSNFALILVEQRRRDTTRRAYLLTKY